MRLAPLEASVPLRGLRLWAYGLRDFSGRTRRELRRLARHRNAADLVEAIDSPCLQDQRGWDLSRWRYDLIPWGVCFRFQCQKLQETWEVIVVAGIAGESAVGKLLEAGKDVA